MMPLGELVRQPGKYGDRKGCATRLGSSHILTSVAGALQDCNAFYPFGEQDATICTSSNTTTHKFTAKERDAESGLDKFDARFYSSTLGRFATPDWSSRPEGAPYAQVANPQTLNLYAYVLNNPISKVDPDGHLNPTPPDPGNACIGDCNPPPPPPDPGQASLQTPDNGQQQPAQNPSAQGSQPPPPPSSNPPTPPIVPSMAPPLPPSANPAAVAEKAAADAFGKVKPPPPPPTPGSPEPPPQITPPGTGGPGPIGSVQTPEVNFNNMTPLQKTIYILMRIIAQAAKGEGSVIFAVPTHPTVPGCPNCGGMA